MRTLEEEYKKRLEYLAGERKEGKRVVGYIPSGHIPEEMIHASGAHPLPLFHGGDAEAVENALPYLGRFMDPFCRAQIGYRMIGHNPLYQMIDLLIVPITDQHYKGIADSWNLYTDADVFEVGIPSTKTDPGFDYYLEGLYRLKEKLESLTGNTVSEQRLREEIALENRIRSLIKTLSFLRKSDSPPFMGKEFVRLVHNSFYTQRHELVRFLEEILEELGAEKESNGNRVRIMLLGSTLAYGDYRVPDLLEDSGASIVMEAFSEGMRDYRYTVDTGDDPFHALAQHYLMKNIPGAYFRGSSKERFDDFLALIRTFNVNGVVFYSLMYRETYDIEAYLFNRILEERNIPSLSIKSDYVSGDTRSLKTRIETFVDTVKRRQ